MAQLAIKGHATRGKEVIELLEMLGGKNTFRIVNAYKYNYYRISGGDIYGEQMLTNPHSTKVFTLEQFFEKFPHKVGDKVNSKYLKNHRIEKMGWKDTHNRVTYKLQGVGWFAADELEPYKEETMEKKADTSMAPILQSEDYSGKRFGYKIPKGYEFDCIKENEIIIKPIKPQYPKTYEECCMIIQNACMTHKGGYKGDLIQLIQKLIICRDAYWKIAGERMGIVKSWEPDWNNNSQFKYLITCWRANIIKETYSAKNCILAFPTKKMRDAFYENFKDLIEDCKELL